MAIPDAEQQRLIRLGRPLGTLAGGDRADRAAGDAELAGQGPLGDLPIGEAGPDLCDELGAEHRTDHPADLIDATRGSSADLRIARRRDCVEQ
jgi:hypothetical protein